MPKKRRSDSENNSPKKKKEKTEKSEEKYQEPPEYKEQITLESIHTLLTETSIKLNGYDHQLRGIRQIMGILNERTLRVEVRKQYGESFAKSFLFRSVGDIASWLGKIDSQAKSEFPGKRDYVTHLNELFEIELKGLLKKYLDEILPNNIQKKFHEHNFQINKEEKNKIRLNSQTQFEIPESNWNSFWKKIVTYLQTSEKNHLLGCNGIGFTLLCLHSIGKAYNEIEIDFRGSIVVHRREPLTLAISLGEAKTIDLSEAKKQLKERLNFLEYVCKLVFKNCECVKIGHIFSTTKSPKDSDTLDNISFHFHHI